MKWLSHIASFIGLTLLPSTLASAQDFLIEGEPPSAAFVAEVERIHSVYPEVWRDNVLAQIALTYSADARASAMQRFESHISRDLCTLKATITTDPPRITLSHDAMLIGISVDQAIVLYLLGRIELSDPQKIVDYIRSEVRRVSSILKDESMTSRADCGGVQINFRSPLGFFGMKKAEYDRLMTEFYRDPEVRSLGDKVGGASIFFTALHEAGHFWINDFNNEAGADAFAIQTMKAGGIPPSLGISALLISAEAANYASVQEGPQRPLCRLLRLAQSDDTLTTAAVRDYLGPVSLRAERLRQFWVTTYAGACD